MLVPISWLKSYIEFDMEIDEFCERMIMSGSNVETVFEFGNEFSNVVVGKIVSIEKHPNADKLSITQVDIGSQAIQIVTGATNVFVGAYVPVALDGAVISGGVTIKNGTLRDVPSNGMLCSCKELGFEDKLIPIHQKDGIFILDKEYTLGQDVKKALEMEEKIVEFEITPNRPDCLSMLGIARELACITGVKLEYPKTASEHEIDSVRNYAKVEIKSPELCNRYCAKVVKDIKIVASPWWLQKRLINAGMRPINNIVDITNYVMLEYGQPLHAFDLSFVSNGHIIVEKAKEGETFTTLDGSIRILSENMLLIKDESRSLAIAGVMGGIDSEITGNTNTILIESANFSGDSIRSTSKKLGLRTEASSRFEKGIDANIANVACERACKLIEELGFGTVVKEIVDIYPVVHKKISTKVRTSRVNKILGLNLSTEDMKKIFIGLEMDVEVHGDIMIVTPPTVRQDLMTEIDFTEEVARIYGYDKMPTTLPKGNMVSKISREQNLREIVKDNLIAMGLNEIQTFSFTNPKVLDKINAPENSELRDYVTLINPLGEDTSIMRTTLISNMLEVLARNNSRNIPSVRAFEIGNVFHNSVKDIDGLPTQIEYLSMASYGDGESFFTIKGFVEELFKPLGIKNAKFRVKEDMPIFHFGRCAEIVIEDIIVGIIGEIHPDVLERYGFAQRVNLAEVDLDRVYKAADIERLYSPLPKYPGISRDIALLVSEEVSVDSINEIVLSNGGQLLESVELFDVYRGKQVKEGHKSLAFKLYYRDPNKTLTDEEVAKVHNVILAELAKRLNAVLREV
ncbi:MAG: phenylalanine--tRNA ligase subunit beta [Eubacteriales bacterium]